MKTSERVLDAALASFGTRGYGATSLDALARDLGVRKQTILYHFGSKEGLLVAVVEMAVADLAAELEAALEGAGAGWERVESVVRGVFRIAVRRPELLGLIRELGRLGAPWVTQAAEAFEPMVKRATEFLEAEMAAGHLRSSDPRLVLVSAYSTVMGVATEVEVLRAVGIEPTLREAARRRRELLRFLHAALYIEN